MPTSEGAEALVSGRRARVIAWRGIDDASRLDLARFVFAEDSRLRASGASVTHEYALQWSLETEDGWRTSRIDVQVFGEGWMRALSLRRDAENLWRADVETSGMSRLPDPGLTGQSLSDAVDCDLGLCPATNAMPILRIASDERERALTHEFAMALIGVPSLQVVRSEQSYRVVDATPDGGSVVEFSAGADFSTRLTVDSDGLVTYYPGLAVAI